MENTRSKPQATMLVLSTVLGILLGTSILLATKINNPPSVPIGTGLDYLLGELVPEYDLEQLDGGPLFLLTCTKVVLTYWSSRC